MRSAVIDMTLNKVLAGLSDDCLRHKSNERGAATSKTLEECFRIIKDARRSMVSERNQFFLQQESWKSRGFDRIMEAPNQVARVLQDYRNQGFSSSYSTRHLPIDQTTVKVPGTEGRNYLTQNSRFQGLQDAKVLRDQDQSQFISSNYQQSMQGNYHDLIIHIRELDTKGLHKMSSWHSKTGKNIGRQGHMEASPIFDKKGKGRDNNVTHQPPYSTHSMVSGTMEYRNVCWKCGNGPNADGPRHDSRQCIGPVLENWETEILKSKHHERNERVFGGEVKERQTETFPQDPTQPSTDAVTEIELRRRQRYERAQLPQPYIYSKVDQVHESSVEEMSIEELIALEMSLNKDKEFVNVIEGDIDEYLLDEPIAFSPQHSLQYGNNKERIIDDKVPLSEAEVLFSAHVMERENAKRPRHHHHIINDEDIEPLPKRGLSPDEVYSNRVKSNSRRRKVEPLINARLEDGPLNYMEILDRTKVEISLKDLAQMSPAARKHWNHGMSRVNDKRSRRKRSQAEISEISLKAQFEADRNPVKNTRFDLPDLSDSSSM
ncbi:hypothetical protein OnM2_095041, partial [Erysiphe neolycopersici]